MNEGGTSGVRTTSERVEAEVGDSGAAGAVDTVWGWLVAAWVRLVGGLLWGVTGFQVGVALDAAGVPVARTASSLTASTPVTVGAGTAGALVLAAPAGLLGVVWTLRWDGNSLTHRRRLLALGLLVTLPFVLSAVEMVVVGIATAVAPNTVTAPGGSIRVFYHVASTLAIAFGAAWLWARMRSGHSHSRWKEYH
jgi:hypothetical protein